MKNQVHSLIIGMGEIGKGLYKLLRDSYEVYGIDKDIKELPDQCYILNVCIPYSNNFVAIVQEYIKQFSPACTIIYSSVPVGTTQKIKGSIVVHSPVMARHPNIYDGLETYTKFIGYDSEDGRIIAGNYLDAVCKTCGIKGSKTTELMKILSLCRYGIYLSAADEMDKICRSFDCDYDTVVKLWENAYNEGIARTDPDKRRPIYDPPKGKIGGHCVLPIMRMFNEQFPTKIISEVLQKY